MKIAKGVSTERIRAGRFCQRPRPSWRIWHRGHILVSDESLIAGSAYIHPAGTVETFKLRSNSGSRPSSDLASSCFRIGNNEINKSADKMQEQDDQYPGDLFAIANALVGDGMDQHPNPEHAREQNQQQ